MISHIMNKKILSNILIGYTQFNTSVDVWNMNRTFILTIVLMCIGFGVSASVVDSLPTHYIVAFDQSVGKYSSDYQTPSVLSKLDRVLVDNGFDSKRDFVSIVGYTMELGRPSLSRYVRPYTDVEGDKIIWRNIGDGSLRKMFPKWPAGQPSLNPGAAPFASLQSLAKPYIVMATAERKDTTTSVDRTVLLLVSDEIVNGTDDNYAQEWSNVSTINGADYSAMRGLSNTAFAMARNFNEEFKFIQIPIKQGKRDVTRIPISYDGMYKIVPYEVISAEKPSIHSVTDLPSPLPLQRVRGGFRVNVDARSINPKYSITGIEVTDTRGNIIGRSKTGRFDFVIPSGNVHLGDTLGVKMSLLLKDGLYNGSRISSDNPRYSGGMSVRQVVHLQDEAKILGILPLSDFFWWWSPDDIYTAVMIWDIIIILLFITVVLFIGYRVLKRIATYVPRDCDIFISHK